MRSFPALLAAFLGIASPAIPTEGQERPIRGLASVIDGDTVEIHDIRIRLHGIDAPESGQSCIDPQGKPWRCGQQAALALSNRIGRGTVDCVPTDIDHYGRTVAECFMGRENLNRWMVHDGWAVAYVRYSDDYSHDEDLARAARRGIWSAEFEMPWDWRQARRDAGSALPPPIQRLLLSARSYSCDPRKTCKAINSCDEAVWYLQNCGWGGKLDRDGDGVPCESIC